MNSKRYLRPCVTAMLAAALGATSAHAADNAGPPESPATNPAGNPAGTYFGTTTAMAFKRLDVNRDGYVSREEAKKLPNFEKAFGEADDNRDGKLDADEFIKAQAIYDRVRAAQYVDDSVLTANEVISIVVALLSRGHILVIFRMATRHV